MHTTIQNLNVSIVAMVDEQPGRVECVFSDAAAKMHKVIDKVPIVYAGALDQQAPIPLQAAL